VLGAGALPLNVLETRMNEWVVAQNKGGGGTTVAK
jgi:hypothetical protein